jgi:hypothetical protein
MNYTAEQEKQFIDFDPDLMPEHVKRQIFAAGRRLVLDILNTPGGRELLDAKTAARHARQAMQKGGQKENPAERTTTTAELS